MSRWQDFAACAGQDPALWFPQQDRRGGRPAAERAAQRQALETCAGCPVRAECAEAGQHEDHGIWGGLTPADRARAAGKLPPIRRPGPPPGRTHGSRGTYNRGCRCEECCAAERAYKRQYRAEKRRTKREENAA